MSIGKLGILSLALSESVFNGWVVVGGDNAKRFEVLRGKRMRDDFVRRIKTGGDGVRDNGRGVFSVRYIRVS